MAPSTKYLAWPLIIPTALAGCADRSPPFEPEVAETPVVATHEAGADADLPGLSPELRAVMTTTVTAALKLTDIPPEAAMSTLRDFYREIDARQERKSRGGAHAATSEE